MRSFTFIKALLVGLLILLTPEIWAQEKAESNSEKKEVAPPWDAIDLTSADGISLLEDRGGESGATM